jgi:hypothetical protein
MTCQALNQYVLIPDGIRNRSDSECKPGSCVVSNKYNPDTEVELAQ